MVDKNGFMQSKAKWFVPVLGSVLAILLGTLLMYPMLKMEPRDIPIAIMSEDAGVTFSGNYINAGDELITSITESDAPSSDSSSDSSDIVTWTVFNDQEALQEAMDKGEYYAALTIPSDFSESQLGEIGRQALGNALVNNLPELTNGMSRLKDGSASVHEGMTSLADGLDQISTGVSALETQVAGLPSQTQSLSEGSASLSRGLAQLESGATSLSGGISDAKAGIEGADGAIDAAIAALNSPTPDVDAALQYLTRAKQVTSAVSAGMTTLETGAQNLAAGISSSKNGAYTLDGYLTTLANSAPALSTGVSSLSSGLAQLSTGADMLLEGTQALSEGTIALAEPFTSANKALEELPPSNSSTSSSSHSEEGDSVQAFSIDELSIEDMSSKSSAASLDLLINQGKNPMVSSSIQSSLSAMASSSGVSFDTEYMNPLPDEMSMGFTHMILMILTYVSSYATAAVIANLFKFKKSSRSGLARSLAVQLAYAALLSLVIGVCITFVLSLTVSSAIPFTDIILFVAIASFAFQLLVIAALDWFGMIGMIVPVGLLVVGMGTAYLPTEFLPDFWQQFVYPWDPLRFMVDGFKGILYMGQGFWNASSQVLMVVVLIGLIFLTANLFRPIKHDTEENTTDSFPKLEGQEKSFELQHING